MKSIMKRTFSLILCTMMLSSLCACGDSKKSDETTDAQTTAQPQIEQMTDFVIDVEPGKDIKILLLSDTQITSLANTRNKNRYYQLKNAYFTKDKIADDITERCYKYIDEAVAKSNPDLIVLNGDNIYGETDDSGAIWESLIAYIDKFQIPWSLTFGNHDNESAKGVMWQIDALKKSSYCLFERGEVTGNSNYTVGFRQGGAYKYVAYLMDTNGCKYIKNPGEGMSPNNIDEDKITQQPGIYDDQIKWFSDTQTKINTVSGKTVPSFVFVHIPVYALDSACNQLYNFGWNSFEANHEGDFGRMIEIGSDHVDKEAKFFNTAKALGTTGIFMAHEHDNNASIMYEGVRLTFGLKTGTYTFYQKDSVGGTLIIIPSEGEHFTVNHLVTDLLK